MNILVIGGGAREHAICWALKKSKNYINLFCSPGNAGIAEIAKCEKLDLKKKIEVYNFCKINSINFVVIGPEEYLADGLSDYLLKKGINTFGPSKEAAKLETSKSFAKAFLSKNNILTPNYDEFSLLSKALLYLKKVNFPIVIKADGLAAGKGVIICKNIDEASLTIKEMMKEKKFGSAGEKIIIEEFIEGFEISFFAFIDKNSFLPLGYALDHKRAFDGDSGPNTGGMGCFYPSKKMNKNIENKIIDHVLKRTFLGLKNENITYRGVLFFGLMIKNNEPYVIEYNARFGDPECQTLLRNLKTDLLKIFISTTEDKLHTQNIENFNKSVVCVVLASNGYPGNYNKNKIIENLKNLKNKKDIVIFHAGTKISSHNYVSNGGRVLSITATANNIEDARKKAYKTLEKINWKEGYYRKDIGIKNK